MEAAAAPPPRQLTVGGVINEALDLYGKHAGVLLGTAFVVFVIAGILQGILTDDHGVVLRFVASIVSIVAGTLYTGFVVTLVADVRDGKRDFSAGELISSASEAIPRLIGNGILLGIAVAIGFLLLIVPGLYLLTIWAVVAPAIVAERRGVLEAFGRSHELVRGHGWTVFGAIVVAFLILILVGIFAAILGAAIGDLTGRIIFAIIANILVAPFPALVASVLFFELGGTHQAEGRITTPPPTAPAV
jgi:MFS family permease